MYERAWNNNHVHQIIILVSAQMERALKKCYKIFEEGFKLDMNYRQMNPICASFTLPHVHTHAHNPLARSQFPILDFWPLLFLCQVRADLYSRSEWPGCGGTTAAQGEDEVFFLHLHSWQIPHNSYEPDWGLRREDVETVRANRIRKYFENRLASQDMQ